MSQSITKKHQLHFDFALSKPMEIVQRAIEQHGYQLTRPIEPQRCLFKAYGTVIEIVLDRARGQAIGRTHYRFGDSPPELVSELIDCRNSILDHGSWQIIDGALCFCLTLIPEKLNSELIKGVANHIHDEVSEFRSVLICDLETMEMD